MSDRPLIAITMNTGAGQNPLGVPHTRYYLRTEYVERVREAGGEPFLIPPGGDVDAFKSIIDGWLIPGGDDIDPSLWGEAPHPEAGSENRDRTEAERRLYRVASQDLPILGICYGCQLLNVVQGGSLHQHLPDILGNDSHRGDPMQEYRIEPNTKLAGILGSSASGRSWHHQAIHRLGQGLKVNAWHEDGTIEGVESTGTRWMIGVQWHPERSDAEATPKLFTAFIEAARKHREEKLACGTW